ncbi:MAG: DNA recombination protein RmuC [Candidatus Dormibacteraceae bacterium]
MAFELLFALLLVATLLCVGGIVILLQTLSRRTEGQATELAALRAQLAVGGQSQDSAAVEMRSQLSRTQELVEGVRQALTARQQIEDDSRQSLRRLEAVIAGSSTRGAAGENIIEEALQHLPAEMLQRNIWVRGKVVEFGLRLPGGKLLPIDSKWAAGAALQDLSAPDIEPARRHALALAVEKEVEKRVREVAQYIDPATTTPFALAAIPDGAYAVCRSAFAEAHRHHVIIVGFSMTMPYVLSLYQLHLQFARTVDMENLQAYLMDIDRHLERLDVTLENKLRRAMAMLENTYGDGKQVVAQVRASVRGIQASEGVAAEPELSLIEPAP